MSRHKKEITDIQKHDTELIKDGTLKDEVTDDLVKQGKFDDSTGGLDLNDIFEGEMGEQNAVLKELFTAKDVEVKTELTANQIKIISLLEVKALMIDSKPLAFLLKKFETLQISKDRKSRGEFVGSFQGTDQSTKTANLLTKFGNVFKNDK